MDLESSFVEQGVLSLEFLAELTNFTSDFSLPFFRNWVLFVSLFLFFFLRYNFITRDSSKRDLKKIRSNSNFRVFEIVSKSKKFQSAFN